MALNNLGLGFIFTAKDRASGVVQGLNRNMSTLGKNSKRAGMGAAGAMIGIGAAAGTMAVGVAGVGKAIDLANVAGEFGQQVAAVGAISQASEADLAKLERAAIDAGIATQFSPDEAIQGLRSLAVQGFNAQESTTALTGALDLAAGGAIPVADAASAMASSLRVFGLDADQAGVSADKLLRITNRTALQANEMSLAIGNLGRGVGLTKQSMDEMLPALGLVRNSGVQASVASSSVSSALIFMAKNAKAFDEIGVKVTDATGKFRPFMDIVLDTQAQLASEFPNAADRSKKAVELFGRFGTTAFAAIASQTEKGIRDTEGNLLQGAAAVDFLRGAMRNAGGAAEEFKSKLLDTFRGQKVLLQGSMQTLAVVAGKTFAAIFKPIITVVIAVVNALINVWDKLPQGMRTAIAAAFLFGSAMLVVVGAATGVALVLILLAPFLVVLAKVALIAAAAMLALGAVFVAAAAVAVAAWMAIKNNWGGMGDWFAGIQHRVRVAWEALRDILSGKGLSVGQRDLLKRLGLLEFVASVAMIVQKAKEFWRGLVYGFKAGLEALTPAWEMLKRAIDETGKTIGLVTNQFALAGGGTNDMASKGASLGRVLANLVGMLIETVAWTLMIANTFVKAGVWMKDVFGDAIMGIIIILKALWSLLKNVGQALLYVLTLGGAGGNFTFGEDFAGIVKMVQESDEARANQAARLRAGANIPMAGAGVPGAAGHPAAAGVSQLPGTGIATLTPAQITQATAAGVQQGIAAQPVQLQGEVDGNNLITMVQQIQREVGNRGGTPGGTPGIPGGRPL